MRVKSTLKSILLFTLVLVMAVSVLSFVSCDRSYDEDEVTEATASLLRRAEVLNEVYFGKGIGYITTGEQNGSYFEADAFHLKTLGFSTVEELRQLTLDTYSDSYSASLFSTKLDTSVAGYIRYYQKYEDELKAENPMCIMVFDNIQDMADNVEYDYSSITVKGADGDFVNVNVKATVTSDDGKKQTATFTIQLIEEERGWRINNPTHAKYNEYQDEYDELINNGLG